MSQFCSNCGSALPEGSYACPNCGQVVAAPEQSVNNYSPYGNQSPVNSYPYGAGFPSKKSADLSNILRWVTIGCSVLLVIATFLPFITASLMGYSTSINIWDCSAEPGDGSGAWSGILLILLAIAGVALAVVGGGKRLANQITAGVGAASLLIIIIQNSIFWGAANEYGAASACSNGVGFWFLLIAALGVIASGVVSIVKENKA